MNIKFDALICLGCGRVGPPPPKPALSCCPERDTVTLHQIEHLRPALRSLIKYAEWQINEGPGHHPTLPSAVSAARAALSPISDKGKAE